MTKKEIQAKVRELLGAGVPKRTVFAQLANQGVKDSRLANYIASYADPVLCERHVGMVNILISILLFQAFIGFGMGLLVGARAGSYGWLIGAIIAAFPLLFAWGFYTNRVGFYNAYLLLSILQLPKALGGITASPVVSTIMISINLGIIFYAWYVRDRIFPDFAFIAPRKIKGQYVFSN